MVVKQFVAGKRLNNAANLIGFRMFWKNSSNEFLRNMSWKTESSGISSFQPIYKIRNLEKE